eukprot:603723-Pyramimonas_sp.AAC.1
MPRVAPGRCRRRGARSARCGRTVLPAPRPPLGVRGGQGPAPDGGRSPGQRWCAGPHSRA